MRTLIIILGGFVLLAVSLGVARAGYSFAEELPIFLLIFLVPVAAAVLIRKFF